MPNVLMPQQAQPPQTQPGLAPPRGRKPVAPAGLIKAMEVQHAQSRAKLEKLEEVQGKARAAREQFNHLMNLGDLVTEEDIVRSASKIVAAGAEPMTIAGVLADMPTGTEAMKEWIAGKEQEFRQKEAQLGQVLGLVRHETGLAALRLLAADSFAEASGLAPGEANPLAAPAPGLSAPAVPNQMLAPSVQPMENELMGDSNGS